MKSIYFIALRHRLDDTRVFHKEALSLARNGYAVTILGKGKTQRKDGVYCISVNSMVNAFFQALKAKADVYHVHDQTSLVIGIFLSLMRKKVVYDMHEHYFFYPKMQIGLKKVLNSIYAYIVEPIGVRLCDVVIGVTPKMEQAFSHISKKFALIYNFYSGTYSNPNLYKQGDPVTLIYQGGMKEERGIFLYVDMVEGLKKRGIDVRLLCVGPFPSKEKEKAFHTYVQKKNLSENILIVGQVSFEELSSYTKKAHIGLNFLCSNPNNNYGIQNKIFEYFSQGIPVLSTNNVEFFCKEIVPRKCGNVCTYGDVEESINVAVQMIQNLTVYQKNVVKYREDFSWKESEKTLLAIYKELFEK